MAELYRKKQQEIDDAIIAAQSDRLSILNNKEQNFITNGGATSSTNTTCHYFTNEVINTVSDLGVVDNSPTLGWSFTALKRCEISLSAVLYEGASGTSIYAGITRNSTALSSSVISIIDEKLVHLNRSREYGSTGHVGVSKTFICEINDVIRIQSGGSMNPASENRVFLTATEIE